MPRPEAHPATAEELAALDPAAVARVAAILRDARRVLFVTGAGISADSGLPTYRGVGGLYEDTDTDDGLPIEDALSGEMLRARPAITWKYVRQIEESCRGAGHNAAHEILAEWERAIASRRGEAWVLTQNVDGFHRDAGSRNVIEVHGNLRALVCVRCGARADVESYEALPPLPACARCDGLVRPDVVLFGEMLPSAAIERLEQQLERGFDAVMIIGTTAVFPYIAAPVVLAARAGRATIEINPGRSEVSRFVRERLAARAVVALTAIDAALGS